jgi:hypothetical protein
MNYATIAIYCFIGFFEFNYSCYAYAISYNACKYCMMFNKHMPVSLRSSSSGSSGSSNILNPHKTRPNSANYGSSASSDNEYNELNYFNQFNEVYIPFPFDTPNISKIMNTSNTTKLSNTTDTVSNLNKYIDNLYFKYTLGGIVLIIDKFYGYYNFIM